MKYKLKHGSTLFLKAAVTVLGLGVLAICIFALPAGIRAEDAGGYRYIIAGLYLPAIPFFFALYQTLKLLGYIDISKAFSDLSVKALQSIQYCAIMISALFAAGMPFIFRVADMDDAPGVVAMALVIISASIAIAVFAAVLRKLLREALAIKAENELTV